METLSNRASPGRSLVSLCEASPLFQGSCPSFQVPFSFLFDLPPACPSFGPGHVIPSPLALPESSASRVSTIHAFSPCGCLLGPLGRGPGRPAGLRPLWGLAGPGVRPPLTTPAPSSSGVRPRTLRLLGGRSLETRQVPKCPAWQKLPSTEQDTDSHALCVSCRGFSRPRTP